MKKWVGRLLCLLAMAILLAACLGCECQIKPLPPQSYVEEADYFAEYIAPSDYPPLLEAHV